MMIGKNKIIFTSPFSKFGKINRARDYTTGEYRGYGYLTFLRWESALKALEVMDRKGFEKFGEVLQYISIRFFYSMFLFLNS